MLIDEVKRLLVQKSGVACFEKQKDLGTLRGSYK
jgi:hypothetical protein